MEFTAAFFDEASAAWMKNKVKRGYMLYYVCGADTRSGYTCKRKVDGAHPCKQHSDVVTSPLREEVTASGAQEGQRRSSRHRKVPATF